MRITWLGHSCFKLEKDGYTVIVDPYKDGSVPGLAEVRECADLVLCSHEHGDHSGRECVKLQGGGRSPFKITEIPTYHDEWGGKKRGENVIRIFDDGHSRAAHLGDLGCPLTPDQEELLMNLDLVMIPVGGFYTIDGGTAAGIVKKLRPGKAVPMHYRDPKKGYGFDVISTLEPFTGAFESVVKLEGNSLDTEKDYGAQVIVLEPGNAAEV